MQSVLSRLNSLVGGTLNYLLHSWPLDKLAAEILSTSSLWTVPINATNFYLDFGLIERYLLLVFGIYLRQ